MAAAQTNAHQPDEDRPHDQRPGHFWWGVLVGVALAELVAAGAVLTR